MTNSTREDLVAAIAAASLALGNSAVWTPAIEQFGLTAGHWLGLDAPGGYVFGIQRNGKTWGIDYLKQLSNEYFAERLLFLVFTIPEDLPDRDGTITDEFLLQSGLATGDRAKTKRANRLRCHILDACQALGVCRVVLVLDEAQNLSRAHLGQVMYWFNVLTLEGIRPFILLVGQPELQATAKSFETSGELQVSGRFFELSHEFLGISIDQVGDVFAAFEQPIGNSDGTVEPSKVSEMFAEASDLPRDFRTELI